MSYTFTTALDGNSTNLTPSTGSVAIYMFKETLKNSGWTVQSSGDGTTYFSSSDGITTGGSGAGGMGNTRSWVRLRMPTTDSVNREIVIQRTTTDLLWRIKYSHSSNFTGGSPSATQVPSATDEVTIIGSGSDSSPTGSSLFPANNTYRFSCGAGGSSEGYTFWSASFPIGGGNPNHVFVFDRMITGTFPSQDNDPYIMHLSQSSAFSQTSFDGSDIHCFLPVGWIKKGYSGQGFTYITGSMLSENGGDRSGTIISKLGTNPHNSKDDVLPIVYGRRASLGLPAGYKGIGSMIKWLGVNRVTGDTLTVSSTRDRIVIFPMSLPWDGSVTVI